jgi:hypothetical protein
MVYVDNPICGHKDIGFFTISDYLLMVGFAKKNGQYLSCLDCLIFRITRV